jgi:hypothetical protein
LVFADGEVGADGGSVEGREFFFASRSFGGEEVRVFSQKIQITTPSSASASSQWKLPPDFLLDRAKEYFWLRDTAVTYAQPRGFAQRLTGCAADQRRRLAGPK